VNTTAGKHRYAVQLVGATVAIGLVAVLTARAAQLDDGTGLSVLAPFGLVAVVPLAALAWLRTDQHIKEQVQAPSGHAQESTEPTRRLGRTPTPNPDRRVA
jgi:hypothetical protein